MKPNPTHATGGRRTRAASLTVCALCLYAANSSALAQYASNQQVSTGAAQPALVPLKKVLAQWEKQHGSTIGYASDLVRDKRVSLQLGQGSLEENLATVLAQVNLRFEKLSANRYVVVPAATVSRVPNANDYGIQDVTVTGRVVDAKGEGLPGVTVVVKGTTLGASSAPDGSFTLNVPANSTLVFSFVGFVRKEVPVTGAASNLTVNMVEDAKSLDEVVVVGYGTQKKSDLTGSVSSVSSEDFNVGPQLSPQQLIQGKMAGVNISQNSGKPGGSNTVRIRGGTSLTGSNDPLYVIDGVPISTTSGVSQANIRGNGTDVFDQEPTNPLMTLNPNDIESVTVLKDASATAIYGSRGANGVIVITTKKGRAGKAQVTYNVMAGVSKVANTLDVLSADQYRAVVNELGLTLDDKGESTNWQDKIYRTAKSQDHSLSLTGGTDKTLYRASLGYGDQQGVMLGSNLTRANASINVNHAALNDKLKFDLVVNYGQTKSSAAPVSNTVGSEAGTSMNYEALVFNPTYPVYDANGAYNHVGPFRVNPVSFSTDITDERTAQRLLGNLSTTYKILDPLSINVSLGYTRQEVDRNSFIQKSSPLGEGLGGYASTQKLSDYSKLLETVLRFNKTFGRHAFDAIAGYSYQYFLGEGGRTTASGFLSDSFKWYSLQAASTVGGVSSFQESNTLISMYSRVNYDFNGRFLVTGTIRRDGSSRFGSGNKWGLFPSGSVAWRISQEKFYPTNPVSDLKVRASYGVTGNQEIGNLNSLTTLGASNRGYLVGGQRVTIVLPQQYANPDLKWEQTAQVDVGLDFGLFDNRIHGTFDYYRKETTDLLLRIAVPSPSVVTTQLANVGSVENKGIELELGANIISKGDFDWSADVNFSRNRNKVLSLSNNLYKGDNIQIAPLQGAGLSGIYAQLITPGEPLGTFYGRKFIGVENGVEQFEPGNQVIGSAQPNFTYGVSNSFQYKAFSLSFNIRGSVGNDVFNLTANNLAYESNLPGRNILASALNDGIGREQPKQYSSRWIEDGSFARLDNITLGYTFNVKNSPLSNARIFLTGQNLFLITNYSGLDPEVNAEVSGTGVAPLGIDYLSYPRAKTVSLGASVSF
ncbi:SusC/RagA family TonB-linked outer membrane protein [Hymenobacter norwichensis]|uniref:SusC/RagA family TonB-linked outer membrane protein n=1 Tax=Hymenobacter norwichensis TaxID=223903 RepID=UPI0009FC16C8|nr:SusC/RagA family TonB-linked outer membrane protein [Hymenobacter norwichensis]